ncbi:excinuclease ABC subunit UvrA [Mannheimia sp. AT1]|uniref:Leukotoxin translocation ATP-binding protein LktB n=1 Tax=Mannheimia cairinae TaxID=3025936 RepID=A0ABT5MMW9_9PAST|nr:excinuclease ABC subunit UvrA [Mannheimia cairinae]MDD0822926.1 excinuclease ABC subunit UvrA [Mannheimia cairinae]MDD0826046.1 excinuclease ABC subunit UvrA [Mannheimia cairinae]
MPNAIKITNAFENNLKHVSVSVPKNELVVFCGVSGSGKSSLVFDVLAVESERQWQASYPMYIRNKMPHYERPKVERIESLPPAIVIDQKPLGGNSRSTVGTASDIAPLLRLLFSRAGEPSAGGSMAYSPNHPLGMCSECTGLGERLALDENLLFDTDLSLKDGGIRFSQFQAGWQSLLYFSHPGLDIDKKLTDFSPEEWRLLKYGGDNPVKIEIRSNNTGRVDKVDYEGVVPRFRRLYLSRDIGKLKVNLQDEIRSFVSQCTCEHCGGSGLNPQALSSRINGLNILQMQAMSVAELSAVLQNIAHPLGTQLARQMLAQIERMVQVGIGYLALDRKTDTLSGGEAQRLKLVRHLGSSLSNISYIFDEPTAGLHPFDAERIGRLLLELKAKQNNVLIVEHHRQMIELADTVIELGTGAGANGGKIIFAGSLNGLKNADTPTAEMLRHRIAINAAPLPFTDCFEIKNACLHNLKNISVSIPKGVLTAVTGVAGSGKSTLACVELASRYPAVVIDQKPIGTSIRSTPATYTGIMDEIRKLFAKAGGVSASMFSFNSPKSKNGGACEACGGKGEIAYDMAFADAVVEVCEQCNGKRYNDTALSYRYQDKNIMEVMRLTLSEAYEFFDNKKIRTALGMLMDVGLGYLTLGQPTSTLSGGEVQRIKLAGALNQTGKLFILDEPSTGLHNQDCEKLLELLRKLVANGNSVVMVEHRPELIAQADWVIDMGEGGGSDGGEVLFSGTVADLLDCKRSKTAEFLRKMS